MKWFSRTVCYNIHGVIIYSSQETLLAHSIAKIAFGCLGHKEGRQSLHTNTAPRSWLRYFLFLLFIVFEGFVWTSKYMK